MNTTFSEAGLARVLEAVKKGPGHTAGPWSFVPSIPEDGYECFWIENGGEQFASVYGPQNDKQEARARLIAAAPDLLEALREMLKQFTKTPSTLKDSEIRGKAHAAIAKATGEQS